MFPGPSSSLSDNGFPVPQPHQVTHGFPNLSTPTEVPVVHYDSAGAQAVMGPCWLIPMLFLLLACRSMCCLHLIPLQFLLVPVTHLPLSFCTTVTEFLILTTSRLNSDPVPEVSVTVHPATVLQIWGEPQREGIMGSLMHGMNGWKDE